MRHYTDIVLNSQGRPVAGATVTIYTELTYTTKATIYSDDGSTTTANPVTTDTNGRYDFYVADGRYWLSASDGTNTARLADIEIADISERNSGDTSWTSNSLTINTELADGLTIQGGTLRKGIVINPTSQQGAITFQNSGVSKWQLSSNVDNGFTLYNAQQGLIQLALTPGTNDTSTNTFIGSTVLSRTTTVNNGASTGSVYLTDNNTTGTAGGTQNEALNVNYTAGAGATQSGNGIGIVSSVTVTNSAAVTNSGNEFASYLASNTSNSPNAIRQWGAFDFSCMSSTLAADDFIQGGSLVVNRYNTGANRNGSGGLFIYTKPNQGAGAKVGSTTYPLQVGLQIAGWSGASTLLGDSPSNATLQSRTSGFTTALKIGGAGSGWDSPYLSDRSRIGTGLDIQDIATTAISITNPYGGTSPPTPNLMTVTGTTWNNGIDLSGATFGSRPLDLGTGLGWAGGYVLQPNTGAAKVSFLWESTFATIRNNTGTDKLFAKFTPTGDGSNDSITIFGGANQGSTPTLTIAGATTVSNTLTVSGGATVDPVTISNTGSNRNSLTLNNGTAGQQSVILCNDAGTTKWLFGKNTDNTFVIYDAAASVNAVVITTAAVPTTTFNTHISTTKRLKQGITTFTSTANASTADLSLGNIFQHALTENTTLTASNIVAGLVVTFIITQNASAAKTFAWPATVHGGMTVSATLSSINTQQFIVSNNGTDLYPIGAAAATTGGTP